MSDYPQVHCTAHLASLADGDAIERAINAAKDSYPFASSETCYAILTAAAPILTAKLRLEVERLRGERDEAVARTEAMESWREKIRGLDTAGVRDIVAQDMDRWRDLISWRKMVSILDALDAAMDETKERRRLEGLYPRRADVAKLDTDCEVAEARCVTLEARLATAEQRVRELEDAMRITHRRTP